MVVSTIAVTKSEHQQVCILVFVHPCRSKQPVSFVWVTNVSVSASALIGGELTVNKSTGQVLADCHAIWSVVLHAQKLYLVSFPSDQTFFKIQRKSGC